MHGNRASADRIAAAQSGRAMELMNQSLIWLVDRLRASYGEGGLLALMDLVVRASHVMALSIAGPDGKPETLPPLEPGSALTLRWPPWFPATASDRQQDALALKTLTGAGILSRATATRTIAADYDIPDPAAEIAAVGTETAATPAAASPDDPVAASTPEKE